MFDCMYVLNIIIKYLVRIWILSTIKAIHETICVYFQI